MDRRGFLIRTTALGCVSLGATKVVIAAEPARPSGPPRGPRIVVRDAYIVTLDPKLGELRGDLLVDNGRIAAVGPKLQAPGAQVLDGRDFIVLPGFIDSHRHTWQSAVRHIGSDWTFLQYLTTSFTKLGIHFRAQDVYAGNLLGRLAALESGITTMLDWSHIMNTPEHADAAIQALRETEARSVFAMGWPQTPEPFKWIQRSTLDFPDDIRRVRKTYFANNTGLVTMQMAARGPSFGVMETVARDLGIARDLGLKVTIHEGGGEGILAMQKAGMTGPDITYVHLQSASEEALRVIKDTGGKVSISPLNEEWKTPWHGSNAATVRLLRQGILPSLSVDTETVVPGDMFSSMRGTLQSARYGASNDPAQQAPQNPRDWNPAAVVSTRKILEMATVGGAAPCGLESEVGTLTPGKAADFILLRASHLNYFPVNDAVGAVVVAADTGSVDSVFVAGKALKYNGRLVNSGLVAKARRMAVASRDYLFEKAGLPVPEGLQARKA